ncbi:hypothetical protein ACWEVD_20265 [Nocardia thailandica]|uniref:Chaplin domain-containing protein n=1 Tax=Nocardia thailandica TaxID=257275 RepID=A0ABW6PR64_9NOCA|nr:hypothetical protein [Nocardia thailandica]
MSSRIARPFAVTALALTLGALGAGTASAATVEATPIVGSVAICTSIPVGPISINVCL